MQIGVAETFGRCRVMRRLIAATWRRRRWPACPMFTEWRITRSQVSTCQSRFGCTWEPVASFEIFV